MNQNPIQENVDFYYNEQGYKVFTEIYHLKRGYCCKSGCKNCPFGYDKKTDTFRKDKNKIDGKTNRLEIRDSRYLNKNNY